MAENLKAQTAKPVIRHTWYDFRNGPARRFPIMQYAIGYTKSDTTLTFWLNRFWAGGFIWSLVRTGVTEPDSSLRHNQPALRFDTRADAESFIVSELASNPLARVFEVQN
jgi:hypothetical protein